MNDQLAVLGLTVGSCLATGVVGVMVLRALRRRRVVVVLVLAALVPVLAVAVSMAVNVQAMFISPHDSQVMATSLVAALVTAVVLAVVVARWLVAGSRAVGRGLQVLGADEGAVVEPAGDGARRRTGGCPPSWPRSRPSCRRPAGGSRPPAAGSGTSRRRGASSSRSCRTTCGRRWPGCARWRRASRTVWSTTCRRRWTGCGRAWTG